MPDPKPVAYPGTSGSSSKQKLGGKTTSAGGSKPKATKGDEAGSQRGAKGGGTATDKNGKKTVVRAPGGSS